MTSNMITESLPSYWSQNYWFCSIHFYMSQANLVFVSGKYSHILIAIDSSFHSFTFQSICF